MDIYIYIYIFFFLKKKKKKNNQIRNAIPVNDLVQSN